MRPHSNFTNIVDYKNLLCELLHSIDEYTFSRVIEVTPKFEQFISEVEDIRTRLNNIVDTRNDGK